MLCWRSWAALGAYVRGLGPHVGGLGSLLGPMFAVLGLMLAVLGRSWGRCWRSWRLLEPLLALLGRLGHKKVEEHDHFENVLKSRAGARSGAWGAVLRRSWGLCWRSWVALGAYVGDPGPLLGLYWRSWAALGAAACGPGPLLEPMLAVLGHLGA